MTCFTGDIHGDPGEIAYFCNRQELTKADVLVILGDIGANYSGGRRDELMKSMMANLEPTFFCIHGNHEQRPANIPGYELRDWRGGKVWVQENYPNLLFAKDGEIFKLGEYRYLVIGGAYSIDKFYRLQYGDGWGLDEQPSEGIKAYVENQIQKNEFDVILSHTCPYKYEPREMFLASIDPSIKAV